MYELQILWMSVCDYFSRIPFEKVASKIIVWFFIFAIINAWRKKDDLKKIKKLINEEKL